MSRMFRRSTAGGAVLASAVALVASAVVAGSASADTVGPIDFENYAAGSINGQQGWQVSNSRFDVAVNDNAATPAAPQSFQTRSLRISNAYTSGSFGDQLFSPSLANEAGETTAANGGKSGGTRQRDFAASFTVASATGALQPGLGVSIAPDRGDGARMSQVRLEHRAATGTQAAGLYVVFSDVEGVAPGYTAPCFQCANFVSRDVAGPLDPSVPHTIGLDLRFVDGPSNDVVRVSVDGSVVATGQSWEDYYYYDTESAAGTGQVSRTVDSLLFRLAGPAAPGVQGQGFLFDDVSTASGPLAPYLVTAVDAAPVLLKVNPLALSVFAGLRAQLTAGGAPLAGRSLLFTLPGGATCTAKTDAKGFASCVTPLSPGQLIALLGGGYTASYAGDQDYLPSSDRGALIS